MTEEVTHTISSLICWHLPGSYFEIDVAYLTIPFDINPSTGLVSRSLEFAMVIIRKNDHAGEFVRVCFGWEYGKWFES